MRTTEILIGERDAPILRFTRYDRRNRITRASLASSVSLVGDKLEVDTFRPTVIYDPITGHWLVTTDGHLLLTTDGHALQTTTAPPSLPEIPYATPVWLIDDGTLVGKYYFSGADQLTARSYRINAVSAVGIWDEQRHFGGYYSGARLDAVLSDVLGEDVPFTVGEDIADQLVIGHLPVQSRRESLQWLLSAYNVNLTKDESGEPLFSYLYDTEAAEIREADIYIGGTRQNEKPASRVEVTEHAFVDVATAAAVTLFDNTDGSGVAESTLVTFRTAPIVVSTLTATGTLTVEKSGVNYAVVSGTGTLQGRPYTHTARLLSRDNPAATVAKVVTVEKNTMVTIANSENVLARTYAYYTEAQTLKAAFRLRGERCGRKYRFFDACGNPVTALLRSMTANVSGIIKAEATFVRGYTPTGQGNNYDTAETLTGEGVFDVPAGGATVVLIGGGGGGSSGGDGSPGKTAPGGTSGGAYNDAGDGGLPGKPGTPGKVLTVKLSAGRYRYKCGVGGTGGVSTGTTPTDGTAGTETELYDEQGNLLYSTADGQVAPNGYVNLFTGELLALAAADDAVAGAKGGRPGSYAAGSVSYGGETWTGGANGSQTSTSVYLYNGGGGGGAAVGANGASVGSGDLSGGAGADAEARANAAAYGSSGAGGHGGGGGGSGGVRVDRDTGWGTPGAAGAAGKGGAAGDGGDGCLIKYTKEVA